MPQSELSITQWFKPVNLFGLQGCVGGLQYAMVGFGLCLLKYMVELGAIYGATGLFLTPWDFVSPFLASRERYLVAGPDWLGVAWLIWTLPFLWIGVCMSIRRALDAGCSPWIGLIILIPFANVFGMILLAVVPSKSIEPLVQLDSPVKAKPESAVDAAEVVADIYRPSMSEFHESDIVVAPNITSAIFGIGAGAVYLLLSVLFSVYVLGSYGAAMFFGAPIFTCAVSSYFLNQKHDFGFARTTVHLFLTLLFACVSFLLLGIEGGICIVMALPIFLPLGMLGGYVGYSIAVSCHRPGQDERYGLFGCIAILPCLALIESAVDRSPLIEVQSQIFIEAPIQVVWNQVIDFPEITAEPRGILRTGISYPMRAHIPGSGVGAVRYCEFTTGAFVEPITVWEEPHRLSFDVTSQPEPMSELSPYGRIHPPHLDGTFRSVRGEFRLIAIDADTTRLEGSTWYQLDIGPRVYWKLWTDMILHRIHERVLEHVRDQSIATESANGHQ
jgi:uncharacterized membrane protein YhaH (DUF805 family)